MPQVHGNTGQLKY